MLEIAYLGGGLANLGPILFAVLHSLYSTEPLSAWQWLLPGMSLSSAAVSLGGILYKRNRAWGRPLAYFGLLLFLALAVPRVWDAPALALVFFIVTGSVWYVLSGRLKIGPNVSLNAVQAAAATAKAAAAGSFFLWFLIVIVKAITSPLAHAVLAVSILISVLFIARWLLLEKRQRRLHSLWVITAGAAAIIGALVFWGDWAKLLTSAMAIPMGGMLFGQHLPRAEFDEDEASFSDLFFSHPERLLIFTFLTLCASGTVLLMVPQAAAEGRLISFVDAAFTAVSAVCVTGLIVLDTPNDFSAFGHMVILLLIQIGGLGIMSFATMAFSLMGRRLSIRQEGAVTGLFVGGDRATIETAVRRVFVVTFSVEAVGAAALTILFYFSGDAFPQALWRGIFTAVSAFCNAGFALQSDSMMAYQNFPLILHVTCLLVILGGISPAVIASIPAFVRRKQVGLQVKLVLLATAALLVTGLITVASFEWNNSLAGFSPFVKLTNAWFQAAVAHTAGFNSFDLSAAHPASLSVMMVLMFIGGSPGGTAGGIKTTTAAVLLLAVVAAFRGHSRIRAFGRYIPHSNVYKAAAVVTAVAILGLSTLVAIQLTQSMPTSKALFEVVSALGTVGLSIGGTTYLDSVGKVIIIACMFAGRVGPLTVFLFLGNTKTSTPWKLPEEEIGVS